MVKKLSLLMAIAAALSLAFSATAGASKVTSAPGVLAPVGSVLTGTGNDVTLTSTTLGPITCQILDGKGTLTRNDGTTVEGAGASEAPVQQGCKNGQNAVNITTLQITKFFSTGAGLNGTISFVARVDIGAAACTYTGNNVPFTYVAGGDTITFNNAAGIVGAPAACGTAKLDGTFTIEIGAAPVILD